MGTIGILLMGLGAGTAIYLLLRWRASARATPGKAFPDRQADIYRAPERPEPAQVIETARRLDFLEIEGRQEQVRGTARLLELQFFGTNKEDKRHISPAGERLREFKALLLAGNQLLVEHPSSEGGEVSFFLYQKAEMPLGFGEYLKGIPETPGPAVVFAKSNQRAEVTIEALGQTWTLRDIIWLDVEQVEGSFFVSPAEAGGMARVVLLLGRSGDQWILSADLRSGQGSDTLWVGRQFDPQVEIEV